MGKKKPEGRCWPSGSKPSSDGRADSPGHFTSYGAAGDGRKNSGIPPKPSQTPRKASNPFPEGHYLRCYWQFNKKAWRWKPLPKDGGWQTIGVSAAEAQAHWEAGQPVGVVAGSLGLTMIDFDKGGPEAVSAFRQEFGAPIVEHASGGKGRSHLWYPGVFEGKAVTRSYPGGGSGEVFGVKGYVNLWDPETLFAGLATARKLNGGALPPAHPVIEAAKGWPQIPRGGKRKANGHAHSGGEGAQGGESGPCMGPAEAALKLGLRKSGQQWEGACPACGGDDRFRIHTDGGFYCRKCCADWKDAAAVKRLREALEAALGAKYDPGPRRRREGAKAAGERPVFPRDADGFRGAMELLDERVRYNLRHNARERSTKGGIWTKIDDGWEDSVRAELGRRVCYRLKDGELKPYVIGVPSFKSWVSANSFDDGYVDDFALWLEEVPEWDGTKRLAGLVEMFFEVRAEEKGLAEWAGTYLFAGAVNRTLKPGAKQDESPVLMGPKGAAKSTFIRHTLPPGEVGDSWFGDSFNMAAPEQKQVEAIMGKVIVELGEMVGARKADTTHMKSFLTRQVDNSVRLAYARNPVDAPRRNIFAGSADTEECLPNDPNLRRFVPVRVKPKDGKQTAYRPIVSFMRKHRLQLWAEAKAMIEAGYNPRLPDELKPAAEASAEEARIRDVHISDLIDQHHRSLSDKAVEDGGLTMTEIASAIGIERQYEDRKHGVSKNIATELKARGWEQLPRGRRDGKLVRLWVPE